MVRVLSNDEVECLISVSDLLPALEATYRQLGRGHSLTQPRTDVHIPTSRDDEYYRFKSMGGYDSEHNVYALRINSDIYRWVELEGHVRQERLPRAKNEMYVGIVLLFDADTGTPLAMFPDGHITKLRVGATSALGARELARPDTSTVGLLGAGWQADGQLAALNEAFALERVRVYSPTPESRERFAATASEKYDVQVVPTDEPKAVFEADLVHVATTSRSPVFESEWLEPGTHLGAINSTEIDPRAPEYCDVTVVHSKAGKENDYWTSDVDLDDIPYLEVDRPNYETYPDLASLLVGDTSGREDDDQITFFFNNIGMGLQFATSGAVLYEAACEQGVGDEAPNEWFLEDQR